MADSKAKRVSINEQLKHARALESEGKTEEAIKDYKAILTKDSLNTTAYNRLMILYRKQKAYKKEQSMIKKALSAYEKDILEDQREWKKSNDKSADLSRNLAKALGLIDEDGKPVYQDPQMMAWRKRLDFVEKKLK